MMTKPNFDGSHIELDVLCWHLCKFDGDKVPGDGKLPTEIMEGGKDLETRTLSPSHPDWNRTITLMKNSGELS